MIVKIGLLCQYKITIWLFPSLLLGASHLLCQCIWWVVFMALDSKNNNKLAHYKWLRGNCAQPLSPPVTVKQRGATGHSNPEGESCLCMGALYTSPSHSHTEHTNCNTQTKPSSTTSLITLLSSSIVPKHEYSLSYSGALVYNLPSQTNNQFIVVVQSCHPLIWTCVLQRYSPSKWTMVLQNSPTSEWRLWESYCAST